MVQDYSLTQNVHFLGNQKNVEQFLAIMDRFVFPSRWEGLGLVVVEAQAAGIHSITSTAVPQDAIICNELVERLPLSTSPAEWSRKIVAPKTPISKAIAFEQISKSKFSISNNIKELLSFWGVER